MCSLRVWTRSARATMLCTPPLVPLADSLARQCLDMMTLGVLPHAFVHCMRRDLYANAQSTTYALFDFGSDAVTQSVNIPVQTLL